MKTTVLSKYRICWAEFFPSHGLVTKHDRKQIDGIVGLPGKSPKTYRKYFSSKEKAVEFLTGFNKTLDKPYTVRLFTDRQLSLANQSDGYRIHYTRKQWAETYDIGKNNPRKL